MDKQLFEVPFPSSDVKEIEPLMKKYYDCDATMLQHEISKAVHDAGIDYLRKGKEYAVFENGMLVSNDIQTFYKIPDLAAYSLPYPYIDLQNIFPKYFKDKYEYENKNEDEYNDFLVHACLFYMSYIYYKQKEGIYDMIRDAIIEDIGYEEVILSDNLQTNIYPEIFSLYRMILESKKYKHRGDKITLTYKNNKININTCAWFLDDMEQYFKDRFPNLTLERINELLYKENNAGRKLIDPYITAMMWGTYNLLRENHSYFKNLKANISTEICEFICAYLDCINADNTLTAKYIREYLKDMIKRGYTLRWGCTSPISAEDYMKEEKEYNTPGGWLNLHERYNILN
ncbi:MAG: hypothetical protein LBV11_11585 [Bacillus cereus]|jgi:hypothetical protein|nr:hypothetical protein [Bacillus cereus]